MTDSENPAARELARRLIAYDRKVAETRGAKRPLAFEVCDKLCVPLKVLTGVAGVRSLLSRALALAKAEAPSLETVTIDENGCVDTGHATELQTHSEDTERGGEAFLTKVLGLLITFVGETLTLRFVQQVWPEMPTDTADLNKKRPQ